jgi:hypothetical protein
MPDPTFDRQAYCDALEVERSFAVRKPDADPDKKRHLAEIDAELRKYGRTPPKA